MGFAAVSLLLATMAVGQAAPPAGNFDERTAIQISQQASTLLRDASTNGTGISSVTLERYPGHLTMLTARTQSGGAELHKHFNDIFIVLEGEATEIVGGTIVDAKENAPGEVRGVKVEGGVQHVMRKGDVVHISPDTPHQTVLEPGKTFLYYVIKVEQPQ